MHRNHSRPAALALAEEQRRAVGIQVKVPRLQCQSFGDAKASPPLLQDQQPHLGIGGGGDEHVDFVRLQILRQRETFGLGILLRIAPFAVDSARATPARNGGRHSPACNKMGNSVPLARLTAGLHGCGT